MQITNNLKAMSFSCGEPLWLLPDGSNGMFSATFKAAMNRVHIQESWPKSWKYSYTYDLEEVYGEYTNRGYAYAYDHRRKQIIRLLTERLAQARAFWTSPPHKETFPSPWLRWVTA